MANWISQIWQDPRPVATARAVTHPAWILAVFVLLVNDHVIKPAALLEPLAGKLSDVAGLFLFPVLLATLIGVRTRRGLWLTGGAVAAVFATINVSPTIAAGFDRLISLVVPFATTVDPTDLVALLAIPIGLAFFEPLMMTTHVQRRRRALEAAAVTVGALASMATSSPCEECGQVTQWSQVSILNKTNELQILRIRSLRDGIRLNCELVQADPNAYLADGAFNPPESWFVQSGQEIPINGGGGNTCAVALVESDTTPDVLVMWQSDLPTKSYAFDADVPREIPADGQTLVLDADYSRSPEAEMHEWRQRGDCGDRADLCGDEFLAPLATIPTDARYFWRSQHTEPLHFPRSNAIQGTIRNEPEQCVAPTAADGLAWEPPPGGELYAVDVREGRDGCHEILLSTTPEFDDESQPDAWWLCAPIASIRSIVPEADRPKRVVIAVRNDRTRAAGGFQSLEISVFTLGETTSLDTIYIVRGYGLPAEADFDYRFVTVDGCEPREGDCGQMALPVQVDLTSYDETLRAGESISVGDVQPREIHIVRAEARPVVDTTCAVGPESSFATPVADQLGYLEAVIVRPSGGR